MRVSELRAICDGCGVELKLGLPPGGEEMQVDAVGLLRHQLLLVIKSRSHQLASQRAPRERLHLNRVFWRVFDPLWQLPVEIDNYREARRRFRWARRQEGRAGARLVKVNVWLVAKRVV
jgi:hypothetical protein